MKIRDVVCALSVVLSMSVAAQDADPSPSESPTEAPSEIDLAFQAAGDALVRGPSDVAIAGQGTLKLPEGFGFIPNPQAKRLLEAMGNSVEDAIKGMVVSTAHEGLPYFVVVSYEPEGYISDDDAKDWDTDELLQSFKDGTEADNERRREAGYALMEVVGWAEPPRYDAASHRLVWSVATREPGSNGPQGVNYRTLQLGRHGYIAMNMVTDLEALPEFKRDADTLLGALEFDAGKKYGDFNADTDKVAEYGLAALVAGAAAKKLGFFAVAAAFLVKAWKLLLVGGIALASGVRRFFGKGDPETKTV